MKFFLLEFWLIDDQASPLLGGGHALSLSVRDLLSWTGFVTSAMSSMPSGSKDAGVALGPWEAYVHGAALVLLDGMGLGAGVSPQSVERLKRACAKFLEEQVGTVCIVEHGLLVPL